LSTTGNCWAVINDAGTLTCFRKATDVIGIAYGGTGQTTQQASFDALAPTSTVAGSLIYWDGSHFVKVDGNSGTTNCLIENASGVPSWATCGSGGGAATSDAFVTVGHPADLTAERNLAGTTDQIVVTDGGANSDVTLSLPNPTRVALQDKGGQVFNVKAYGAVGNGSTDDTTAIQNTIDAAEAVGGTTFFPCGTYLVSALTALDGSNNGTVSFQGAGASGGGPGVAPACVTLQSTTANAVILTVGDPTHYSYNGGNFKNIRFLDSNGNTLAGGLKFINISYPLLEHISVSKFTKAGLSAPATPTLTPGSSGSLATNTYYVAIAYGNNSGWTLPSAIQSVSVTGPNGSITVTSPSASGNATCYWTFAGTSNSNTALHPQNSSSGCITIGTDTTITSLQTNGQNPALFDESAAFGVKFEGTMNVYGVATGYINQPEIHNLQVGQGTVNGVVADVNVSALTFLGGNFTMSAATGCGVIGVSVYGSTHFENNTSSWGGAYNCLRGYGNTSYTAVLENPEGSTTGKGLVGKNLIRADLHLECVNFSTAGNAISLDSNSYKNTIWAHSNGTCSNPMVSGGQASNFIYDDNTPSLQVGGYQDFATIAAPSNPASGFVRLFGSSSSGNLECLTSGGANCLPTGGGVTTTGSPASGQVAVFSGTSSITGYPGFTANSYGDITLTGATGDTGYAPLTIQNSGTTLSTSTGTLLTLAHVLNTDVSTDVHTVNNNLTTTGNSSAGQTYATSYSGLHINNAPGTAQTLGHGIGDAQRIYVGNGANQTITALNGYYTDLSFSGAGTISSYSAIGIAQASLTGTGTVSNYYGLSMGGYQSPLTGANPSVNTHLGQVVGIGIGDPTVQTFGANSPSNYNAIGIAMGGVPYATSGPWAIYTGYSTAPSYFGGRVGMGHSPAGAGGCSGESGLSSSLTVCTDGTEVAARIIGDANSSDILRLIQGDGSTNAFKVTSTGIANAQTGFQVAGAAATGAVLVGDGTKFASGTVSSAGLATANKTVPKSISWQTPETGDSYNITFVNPPTAIHLTRVECSVRSGTNMIINLRIVTESSRYSGGTAALSSNLTCTTTGANTTSFSTSAVAAHNPVVLEVVSTSGAPSWGHVDLEYTVD
jgi:hypothetical protein